MRIYILIGAIFLAYSGYDGIGGNQELVKMSLNDIIKKGVGDNRYLEIRGCYATGDIVYDYEQKNPKSAKEVYFPVITNDEFISRINEDTTSAVSSVYLIVKRDKSKYKPECVVDGGDGNTCMDDIIDFSNEKFIEEGLTIKGTARVGKSEIGQETLDLLKTLNYVIPDNIVLVEENEEMRGKLLSWLMLIGGIIVILGVLKSFGSSSAS